METLNLEKLDREHFDNDKQYEKYSKSHKVNNESKDSDVLGNSYVVAIWNLINLFIKEKSCSDDIVKKSPDYEGFSGMQVGFAKNWYEGFKKLK